MTTGELNDEERLQELPEDNGTPFQPPDDAEKFDSTHPITDSGSNMQSHEIYDEGVAGAVEASEPNAGSAVLGYHPEEDTRPQT